MNTSSEIRNLSMEYGIKNTRFTALQGVNLDIEKGEFVSLLGASGCGKSTLISLIDGLRKPSGGNIRINGQEITGTGKDRSIVFQNYSLFPWMTVRKNVAFGVQQLHPELSKAERYEIADEFVEKVGLTEFQKKYPLQLSGGQQQRVAIARALATNTEILLMDEPFGALDTKTRTSIFVTHDVDESIFLSDRIIIMQPNPGRIYKDIKVPFARPRIRENLTDTEEYRNFRKEIVLSFYDAEQEAKYDSQKAVSENHAPAIRSFTADSISPLPNRG